MVRGFSMGGAGVWHLAVHYPGRWAAANPGAGFAETPAFLNWFQKESLELWLWYNCDAWARNLINVPTVAYSGELDTQKQAADLMAAALAKEGVKLTHIIGPKTKHAIEPKALVEVERRLASIAAFRRERTPLTIDFVTYTLRYNRMAWVEVEALEEHWQPARVVASVLDEATIDVQTDNVDALRLAMDPGMCPFTLGEPVTVRIDEQTIDVPGPETDRSWSARFARVESVWQTSEKPAEGRKRPGQQGPIDDGVLSPFVFVRPTGKPWNEAVDRWARAELDHAQREWRRQFRGVAPVVDDAKLDEATIAGKNLILWGDPGSNSVLGKIVDKLPIRWTEKTIKVGEQEFDAAEHGLILVLPNPLNPEHYVVLNSSATYREYDYLNNARQVAKLPDWAVIDVRVPPDARWPGKVVAADFFDEFWKLKTGK
jgi:hypothetical protein